MTDRTSPDKTVIDQPEKPRPRVRPRNAASLVLLRAAGTDGLEVLIGRRGRGARFMPGLYVFPGGRVNPEDRLPWTVETGTATAATPLFQRLARAALRETFEETGLVVGCAAEAAALALPAASPIEAAYRGLGKRPPFDGMRLVGRAITPSESPIRFDARFFVADGALAEGVLLDGEELEDLRWHALGSEPPGPMTGVTRFMLESAIAAWRGQAPGAIPLYRHIRGRSIVGRPRSSRAHSLARRPAS
jgi:8-oxo-dGTP pyrophosphatase MutT (NUDIX family)